MDILTQIENYRPYNEQEERDKGLILDCLRAFEDVFTRENALAHMTASAWVVNERFDRVLMAYHNIYDSWSWLGGHADGDEDLLAVALKDQDILHTALAGRHRRRKPCRAAADDDQINIFH